MTNRLGTARHLPTTEPHSLHAEEVCSMRRGLRWLAMRGTTTRPAGGRRPRRTWSLRRRHELDARTAERPALIAGAGAYSRRAW
jgi:hypothetical protein